MGSFFLHALLLYGLSRPGGAMQESSIPQRSVLEVQLLPASPQTVDVPEEPVVVADSAPSAVDTQAQPLATAPNAALRKAEETAILPWQPADAKVEKFPELAYPPDTTNITATMEIEVSLDKDGKATAVRVVRESPKGMFTEWAWEMGMQGQYKPKITVDGPVASILNIQLDITPGMPLEAR